MPLKGLTYKQIANKLEKSGFHEVSQKGSHVKFAKETFMGRRTVTVPKHKEIAMGTLKSILRQAGLSRKDFEKL